MITVAAEAPPEKAPEMSHGAKEVAAASEAVFAPSKPALEPGRDAFHRIPDSALKALDKVERISTESKGAKGAEVAGDSLPHGESKVVLGGAADDDPAPKPGSGSLTPGT